MGINPWEVRDEWPDSIKEIFENRQPITRITSLAGY